MQLFIYSFLSLLELSDIFIDVFTNSLYEGLFKKFHIKTNAHSHLALPEKTSHMTRSNANKSLLYVSLI